MKKKNQAPVERFEVDMSQGLSESQVSLRQSQKLTNLTKKSSGKSYTRIICENVFTFFNFLWLAIFVALVAVGSYNNLLFAIIIVANTLIAIIQECKAKKTVAKLQLVVAPKITAMRDGKEIELSSNDIVLDDIIILENGNQIPADCEILDGVVDVNESLLTGESVSVKKKLGDKLLAGSFLTSGKCVCRVVAVGEGNYISSVAKAAKGVAKPKSNLFKDLNKLIKIIGYFIIPVGILMFLNNFYGQDTNIATAVEKTCGSLVGMIPAGMFLLVTVALAVGVIKLSKKKTLVQDLYSIEMLARTNVLCLDKTGTITDGTMQVREVVKLEESDLNVDEIIKSINCAQPTENATSLALKKYYGTENAKTPLFNLAFSSERKQTITCFSGLGTFALGAYEYINTKKDEKLAKQIAKYSADGYRVLVLAKNSEEITEEKNLEFSPVALVVIEDHIRSDAPETIKWFKDNGVEIKIISGDNPQTVASIAKKVGVEGADKYVSLEKMSIEEVCEIADKFTVFGRVSPEQKHAIIKTLKQKGKVVAMTGDGVNDTLALKEADCSIAMADGSEVARSISNLVLMNSKFSSLPSVVAEGRQVINNVQKSSSLFLMKTLFTVVLSLITLCSFSLYPFAPAQVFLLEAFVIGIPSFFLSLQPNSDQIKGGFLKNVLKMSIPYAAVLLVGVGAVLVLNKCGQLEYNEFNTLATLTITVVGFMNLCKICFPLNKLRIGIVALSIVFTVVALLIMPDFFYVTTITKKSCLILSAITAFTALVLLGWITIDQILQNKKTQEKN